MEIENSSLYRDVQEVIQGTSRRVHYTWKATLHIGDKDIEALKVISRDTLLEFDTKYGEEMMLTIEVGLGTYAYQIYPNQEKIDITLTRYPIGEVSDALDDNQAANSQRYTAVLVEKGDIKLESNGPNVPSEDALNLVRLETVEFQLVNKTLEQLRLISVGVTIRNATVEDAIKAVLTNFSQKVDVDDDKRPKGVSMVPASNLKRYDHIVLSEVARTGMRLVQVPAYLQRHYGIYSAGLGCFYHQDYWHLYPKYDVERYNDTDTTVTIINVPRNRFAGVERTYLQQGSHLTILATSEVKLEDPSSVLQLNAGNGVRFADANRFMQDFTVTENNKMVAPRARNNSEFMSVERDNGMNNVRFSDAPITSNAHAEYSKLAQRNGAYFSMRWENSDQSLIVPGMVAKILYLDGDEVVELHGSLLKVHHYDQLAGPGYVNTRYHSHSVLVFFVQRSIADTAT